MSFINIASESSQSIHISMPDSSSSDDMIASRAHILVLNPAPSPTIFSNPSSNPPMSSYSFLSHPPPAHIVSRNPQPPCNHAPPTFAPPAPFSNGPPALTPISSCPPALSPIASGPPALIPIDSAPPFLIPMAPPAHFQPAHVSPLAPPARTPTAIAPPAHISSFPSTSIRKLIDRRLPEPRRSLQLVDEIEIHNNNLQKYLNQLRSHFAELRRKKRETIPFKRKFDDDEPPLNSAMLSRSLGEVEEEKKETPKERFENYFKNKYLLREEPNKEERGELPEKEILLNIDCFQSYESEERQKLETLIDEDQRQGISIRLKFVFQCLQEQKKQLFKIYEEAKKKGQEERLIEMEKQAEKLNVPEISRHVNQQQILMQQRITAEETLRKIRELYERVEMRKRMLRFRQELGEGCSGLQNDR